MQDCHKCAVILKSTGNNGNSKLWHKEGHILTKGDWDRILHIILAMKVHAMYLIITNTKQTNVDQEVLFAPITPIDTQ